MDKIEKILFDFANDKKKNCKCKSVPSAAERLREKIELYLQEHNLEICTNRLLENVVIARIIKDTAGGRLVYTKTVSKNAVEYLQGVDIFSKKTAEQIEAALNCRPWKFEARL